MRTILVARSSYTDLQRVSKILDECCLAFHPKCLLFQSVSMQSRFATFPISIHIWGGEKMQLDKNSKRAVGSVSDLLKYFWKAGSIKNETTAPYHFFFFFFWREHLSARMQRKYSTGKCARVRARGARARLPLRYMSLHESRSKCLWFWLFIYSFIYLFSCEGDDIWIMEQSPFSP